MAFLDDVVRTTQKAGKLVADKATDIYDLTKVSYNLATLENKLQDVFCEIGKYMYDTEVTGAAHDEEIKSALAKAGELSAEIEAAKKEKSEIKNQTVCPECGKANAKDAVFCCACGKKLDDK